MKSTMTESQTLLAEYATAGSEPAFRELVTRYVGLVYGTALRLVDGDAHLAEDVTQTVFIDLARKAGTLSSRVMLGGWLHQRTYNVAAPMMRARRRRQLREREAVQMNALHESSDADLERIAPILDEAITHLGKEDRAAIILRFFERRDFRSIGNALGSNEDAARMRVNRALNKLQFILTRRGVTLSAAAIGVALACENLTAAPAGLIATVTGTVMATTGSGVGISVMLGKMMLTTKLKTGILTCAVLTSLTTSLILLQNAHANQQRKDQSLRQQSDQLAQLTADNQRLSRLAAGAAGTKDQLEDLRRLRAEAESLRQQTNALIALRDENHHLQQKIAIRPQTPLQIGEAYMAKVNFGKYWLLAFRMYANEHGNQFPASFDQAASFLPDDFKAENRINPDDFEIVYQGSVELTNGSQIIALREKEALPNSSGNLVKVYGMADGSVQQVMMPSHWQVGGREVSYDSFEAFEKDHIIDPSKQ